MKKAFDVKKSAASILKVLLILQLAYLLLINLALQLPLTQSVVNAIRPEKFHVSWDNAWSWYPFRVYATGISASGQSRSQQWQFNALSASGSIAITPLVFKRVWISDVLATDIDYLQRPRLKADKDYRELLPNYPEISDREITFAETAPRKSKRPWHLNIEDMEASGRHSYWIHQFRGTGEGIFKGDLSFETRGGPFSLAGKELDLRLDTLYLNRDQEVFKHALIAGTLGFAPFLPRENKGIELLRFLQIDANVDVDANSLRFVSIFTQNFAGLEIDGSGKVDGRLRLDRGKVLQPTELAIVADDLWAGILGHSIRGDGVVNMELGPDTGGMLELLVHFDNLEVRHDDSVEPLVTGRDLILALGGDEFLFRDKERVDDTGYMTLEVDDLAVSDLALFQRYLPQKWPLTLHGGQGLLQARARVLPDAVELALDIHSDKASLALEDYRFRTDLDFALRLDNPSLLTRSTSLSGSYIKLSDSRLQNDRNPTGNDESKIEPWEASVVLKDSHISIFSDTNKADNKDVIDLLGELSDSNARQLLGDARGSISFEAEVSILAWISVLLKESFNASVDGRGVINGQLELASGGFAADTRVDIVSEDLAVKFLDYQSEGRGLIRFNVVEGEENPDWMLDVSLANADLRRTGEAKSMIQDVALTIAAVVEDMNLRKEKNELELRLRIDSAKVTDMSAFNGYLPPDGPISFSGGAASLGGDIVLNREDARGWLTLEANAVGMKVDDQALIADLLVNVELAGGAPLDMVFDIKGSKLRLDNVQVVGEKANFDEDTWYGSLKLTRGETLWKNPIELNMEADLLISDSRPVVAMFNNQGWRPKWLSNMLTIKDIEGTVNLQSRDNRIIIPHAYATSDNIIVGGKGLIEQELRDGVIYARYKKADALLKVTAGKKKISLIKAREKFDQYQLERPGR